MIKKIIYSILCLGLTACGGGGNSSSSLNPSSEPWPSYSVATASELPTCPSNDITGRLYYIESETKFQVCKSSGWQDIELGNSITQNYSISSTSTDFSTEFAGELSLFNGGQLLVFKDGTFMLTGSWLFSFNVAGDTDVDTAHVNVMFPASSTGGYIKLHNYVARGSGYRSVFLVYFKNSNSVSLVLDTDNNFSYDATDELLYSPTLTPIQ